jgi:hypothetical protein
MMIDWIKNATRISAAKEPTEVTMITVRFCSVGTKIWIGVCVAIGVDVGVSDGIGIGDDGGRFRSIPTMFYDKI